MRVFIALILVFLALFAVPFFVYGAFSSLSGLQPPGDDAVRFLLGVAVSKLGTAFAFVGIWLLGRDMLARQAGIYVFLWLVMFMLGEVGQALGPEYSWQEAFAGMISEALYFPLAGLILVRVLPA